MFRQTSLGRRSIFSKMSSKYQGNDINGTRSRKSSTFPFPSCCAPRRERELKVMSGYLSDGERIRKGNRGRFKSEWAQSNFPSKM